MNKGIVRNLINRGSLKLVLLTSACNEADQPMHLIQESDSAINNNLYQPTDEEPAFGMKEL
ncbi:MAG: hypothetical protein SVZ03_02560 [Spirochaetota bacterium]|nr:hypothetical protein [Spirochaetota bacterium]